MDGSERGVRARGGRIGEQRVADTHAHQDVRVQRVVDRQEDTQVAPREATDHLVLAPPSRLRTDNTSIQYAAGLTGTGEVRAGGRINTGVGVSRRQRAGTPPIEFARVEQARDDVEIELPGHPNPNALELGIAAAAAALAFLARIAVA